MAELLTEIYSLGKVTDLSDQVCTLYNLECKQYKRRLLSKTILKTVIQSSSKVNTRETSQEPVLG